jgi:16S rRNA (guanine527-N7)-methyltransferase
LSVPDADIAEILTDARSVGFLGPGPIEPHCHHAEGFARLGRRLATSAAPLILDLGSGGGLPGLVVARDWPEARLVLLDANERRTAFLAEAARRLGLEDRVQVVQARAEVAARDDGHRGCYDQVMARSFGVPGTLAECAAPFLKVGGWVIVSEPPEGSQVPDDVSRWPEAGLAEFGLEPAEEVQDGFRYQILWQVEPCPDRFPRRNGVPGKRPLF